MRVPLFLKKYLYLVNYKIYTFPTVGQCVRISANICQSVPHGCHAVFPRGGERTPGAVGIMLNESAIRRLVESRGSGVLEREDLRDGTAGPAVIGGPLHVFSALASTNSKARELSDGGAPEGTMVLSHHQTAGRGRQGRTWISDPGKNLLLSIILRPRVEPEFLGILSLYASVSVSATIEKACGIRAACKWPNDVTVSGRKICGILSESVLSANGTEAVILGIGLNVNQHVFPDAAGPGATSLRIETGAEQDLTGVFCALRAELEARYRSVAEGTRDRIIDEWTARSSMLGSNVTFDRGGRTIAGIAREIAPNGALRIDTKEGTVEVVAGEVHGG